jgi:hypothetical protein
MAIEFPQYLLVHTVSVQPFTGNRSHGPTYGPSITHPCFIEHGNQLILSKEGKEIVATSTVYLPLAAESDFPIDSLVTVNGRPSTVVDVKRRDGGGLPTPDHLEVILR